MSPQENVQIAFKRSSKVLKQHSREENLGERRLTTDTYFWMVFLIVAVLRKLIDS